MGFNFRMSNFGLQVSGPGLRVCAAFRAVCLGLDAEGCRPGFCQDEGLLQFRKQEAISRKVITALSPKP